MALKSAIKKAIDSNTYNYKAVKVWDINISDDYQYEGNTYKTLIIEVQIKKVRKK